MGVIHSLSASLVNQIAAGEVIERPASVVKELMENALDAGATRLEVELADGGTTLIRLTDDGRGMSPDDLRPAVSPHATSKIATVDDLTRIGTFGFRGEALASIASVARVRIVSRPRDAGEGHEIVASDGSLRGPSPCAAPPGTTVEVRHLFHNVPARRKFLRQAGTELAHVSEQVARIALARPDVAIRQIHQGREMRMLPAAGDRRARIADFYGPELAAELFAVERRERDVTIAALLAPPASARATARWQYVFLNGRYISDRFIKYAIREAFRGLVEPSRYPVVFVFLEMDPSRYDVNVHPTKIEVRWRDAGLVQSQVLAVLRETLLSHDLTPMLRAAPVGPDPERARAVQTAIADFLRGVGPGQRHIDFPSPPARAAPRIDPFTPVADEGAMPPGDAVGPGERAEAASFGREGARAPDEGPPAAGLASGDEWGPTQGEKGPRLGGALGVGSRALQIHNTYLVVETPDGMMIIDQHALHERVLYEQFRRRVLAGALESQRLLLPETVELSADHLAAAEQYAELLGRLGIELTPFGPEAAAVQAFPSFLAKVDVREFVRDVLDRLAEPGHSEHPETLLHALLDLMACRAAVKAGDALSPEEIEALVAQRHLVERGSNCPHGRPTTLQLTIRDLERQFKRT